MYRIIASKGRDDGMGREEGLNDTRRKPMTHLVVLHTQNFFGEFFSLTSDIDAVELDAPQCPLGHLFVTSSDGKVGS